jgi:CheY-like chemotaxis protein
MLDILRATPETKNIKIIMMTALSSEDQRTRGEALGANRYLVKSQVGIEDVIKTVHDVLGDKITAPTPVFDQTIAPTTVETKPITPTPLVTPTQSDQVIAAQNANIATNPESTVQAPIEAPNVPTEPITPTPQPVPEPTISPATTDMPPVEYNTDPIPSTQNDIAVQISQELSQPVPSPAPQSTTPQFSSNDDQNVA